MARPLPGYITRTEKLTFLSGPIAFLIVLTAVLSVFSVVTFMCGTHGGAVKALRRKEGKKTVRLGGEKKAVLDKMRSKAASMAKMISWKKVQDVEVEEAEDFGYEAEEDRDGVVWKKTIIKGEKCKPIDFSGKIMYDADGNLLPD